VVKNLGSSVATHVYVLNQYMHQCTGKTCLLSCMQARLTKYENSQDLTDLHAYRAIDFREVDPFSNLDESFQNVTNIFINIMHIFQ
jgi:hypothetical protein